jgi:hypothetical protein
MFYGRNPAGFLAQGHIALGQFGAMQRKQIRAFREQKKTPGVV